MFKSFIFAALLIGIALPAQSRQAEEIIVDLRASAAPAEMQAFQRELSQFIPRSAEDIVFLSGGAADFQVAPFACAAIANTRRPELAPKLVSVLGESISKISPEDSLEPVASETQTEILLASKVIAALREMRYLEAAPYLRGLLSYKGLISLEASRALGQMQDETALRDMLDRMTGAENITLSGYGANGVNTLAEKIEGLSSSQAASDEKKAEYEWLLGLLVKSGQRDEQVKKALLQLLNHRLPELNKSAARALLLSVSSADTGIVSAMLAHRLPAVRMAGLTAIHQAQAWDSRFLPIILNAAGSDPDVSVRAYAVDEIRNLADVWLGRAELGGAVPAFEKLLKDPVPAIKFKVFLALRSLTGRFYPYEGMSADVKTLIEAGPAVLPENKDKILKIFGEKR